MVNIWLMTVNDNLGWWCNNHLEKSESMGRIIPYIVENNKCLNKSLYPIQDGAPKIAKLVYKWLKNGLW